MNPGATTSPLRCHLSLAQYDWQDLPDAQACRIASWYPNAVLEDESRWPEYLDWIVKRLDVMDKVLRPVVRKLP
jgi:hypothetical protein